jgi:hypothetical protein
MASELHLSDIGTILRWTIEDSGVAVDVSGATTKTVTLKRPDATTVTKTLVFSTKSGDTGTGSDGRVEYVIISGDLNQTGTWSFQINLVFASWTGKSDIGTFTVFANL